MNLGHLHTHSSLKINMKLSSLCMVYAIYLIYELAWYIAGITDHLEIRRNQTTRTLTILILP